MLYEHQCTTCERQIAFITKIKDRNEPRVCECGGKTERIASRFLFVANMSKDDPNNNVARVVTRSASAEDQLKFLREQEAQTEANARQLEACSEPVNTGFDDIDISGAWTAAHAGTEQLMRWRADNIAPDPLAAGSPE